MAKQGTDKASGGAFKNVGDDMTFGFSGFGKSSGLFGNGGGLFGGNGGHHGGGLFGGNSGHHGGGLFGGKVGLFGDKGGLFGGKHGFGKDDDCDRDDDNGHGHTHGNGGDNGAGSGSGGSTGGTAGTGWPDIPADTSGITFTVDYDADGVNDNYIPVGRASDLKTFEDYLAVARDQVASDNPDVDPKDVIIKATITSRSGGETYYEFTGLEEGTPAEEEDEDDTDCGDDDDHGHGGDGGHGGHGGGSHGGHGHDDNDDSDDDSDDNGDSDGGHSHPVIQPQSLLGGDVPGAAVE